MALAATMVFEIRTDGSDDNGGGYKSDAGTTDYTQQAAAQLTLTDLACAIASTTLTSATGGFTSAMVGNLIQIKSGTNFTTGWYELTAYTDTNTVTIDRTACDGVGAGSAGTGSVGGALASPGQAAKVCVAHKVSGWKVYIKYGTYQLTTSNGAVSGGRFDLGGSYDKDIYLKGYDTDRDGDWGTNRPTIDANGNDVSDHVIFIDVVTSDIVAVVANLIVDVDNQSALNGVGGGSRTRCIWVDVIDINAGERGFDNVDTYLCMATGHTGNNGTGFYAGNHVGCIAYGCGVGFQSANAHGCVADTCTTGFAALISSTNCTAYACTDGFAGKTGAQGSLYANCYAGDCSAFGFETEHQCVMVNCAGYNNTSGNTDAANPPYLNLGFVTITDGQPLVDPANDDFRPNDTASRGALLRAAGIGPRGQTNAIDIGAVQHADPAGGGGGLLVHPGTSGGARG